MTEQTELRTRDFEAVKEFLQANNGKLEMAELSIRSSAGEYIVQVRSTAEPI